MVSLRSRLGGIVLILAVTSSAIGPATAEQSRVRDARNDQRDGSSVDIRYVFTDYQQNRVQLQVDNTDLPDEYKIKVNVPGGPKVDFVVTWRSSQRHFVEVRTPQQVREGGRKCRKRTGEIGRAFDYVRVTFPPHCLGGPDRIRVKALALDGEGVWVDRTSWSGWTGRG